MAVVADYENIKIPEIEFSLANLSNNSEYKLL